MNVSYHVTYPKEQITLNLPGSKGDKGEPGLLGRPSPDGRPGPTGYKGVKGEPSYHGYGASGPRGQKVVMTHLTCLMDLITDAVAI